jgi:hypothetical protein
MSGRTQILIYKQWNRRHMCTFEYVEKRNHNAILTYLSMASFPEILDAAFPDQLIYTNEVERNKRNVDPLTIKRQRFKELKLEGTLAIISFILGIILAPISIDYRSTLTTALVVGAIASFLLFSVLYAADFVRLRIIYRNR